MRFLILGRLDLGKKNHKRHGTPASLLWSLETSHEPKINMAEKLVDVIVNLRQRGKKDQPLSLLC